jgi:hypothetical protein
MEHPPYFPHLAPDVFWLFPKIKSALREEDFRILKTFKKSDDGNENYAITGFPKTFPTVTTSLG